MRRTYCVRNDNGKLIVKYGVSAGSEEQTGMVAVDGPEDDGTDGRRQR